MSKKPIRFGKMKFDFDYRNGWFREYTKHRTQGGSTVRLCLDLSTWHVEVTSGVKGRSAIQAMKTMRDELSRIIADFGPEVEL